MSERTKNIDNKSKKKNKKKTKVILRAILALLLLIALGVAGFVGYSTLKNGWGVKGMIKTAIGVENVPAEKLGTFQTLVLGVSDDISVRLTDTIMVLSYNPSTQRAFVVSIPRDTFIGSNKNNTSGYDKINAVYQSKGAEGTLEKVNKLLGLDIENYVVINNNALVKLVDEIGGVEFDVPQDMDYDDGYQDLHIHLKAGLQVLDGEQAEGLVRFRKNNNNTGYTAEWGNDDYGRMRTQREFLKAVAKQTLQIKNITKVGALVDILKENVETNIDWDEAKNYISYALDFDLEDIEMTAIPGTSKILGKLWFFLADDEGTKDLVEELIEEQDEGEEEEETAGSTTNTTNTTGSTSTSKTTTETNTSKNNNSNIKIELLNGTGESKALTEATEKLKDEGYNVYKTGKTSLTAITTIINKTNVDNDDVNAVKKLLGTGVISSSNSSDSSVDLTIILGKDYE